VSSVRLRLCPFDVNLAERASCEPARHRTVRPTDSEKAGSLPDLEVGPGSDRTLRTPSDRLHKPSGQAVVPLDGRDFELGQYASPESRAQSDRTIVEWISNGQCLPAPASGGGSDLTINELLLADLGFADTDFVKHGEPTTEPACVRQSLRPLRRIDAARRAREFGPLQRNAVRRAMIDSHLGRAEVNKRTRRIVRIFAWGVDGQRSVAVELSWRRSSSARPDARAEKPCNASSSGPTKPNRGRRQERPIHR
jgi:hypothetical protein